jgi:hypothetical protein
LLVSQTPPKTKVSFKVLRDGKNKNFNVTLTSLPTERTMSGSLRRPTPEEHENETLDGVEVGDLDPRTRKENSIPNHIRGALVTNVDPDSTAFEAGLRPGDVILEMEKKPITKLQPGAFLGEMSFLSHDGATADAFGEGTGELLTWTHENVSDWMSKAPGRDALLMKACADDRTVLRNLCMHLEAIRDGAGPDVDLLLDLNFNAKTEGYLKILRAIEDMDMFWVEIDSFNPQALGYIRRQSPHPISSCETLLGLREFLPYFTEQAMDVAIIDTPWNGVWQSMKIAAAAEHFEVNVAPHNFYGHLCTMMNAHFCAAVPNLRIMETDIDRLAWDHELFTHLPEYVDGHLVLPDRPGWGTEPNEEGLRAHPAKNKGGLLNYGQAAWKK